MLVHFTSRHEKVCYHWSVNYLIFGDCIFQVVYGLVGVVKTQTIKAISIYIMQNLEW